MDYLRRSLQASVGALRMLEEEIDGRIEALVARGELAQDDADRLRQQIYDDATASTRSVLPDLRIEAALHRLNVPTRSDVAQLQTQVEDLMGKIELLLREAPANPQDKHESLDHGWEWGDDLPLLPDTDDTTVLILPQSLPSKASPKSDASVD